MIGGAVNRRLWPRAQVLRPPTIVAHEASVSVLTTAGISLVTDVTHSADIAAYTGGAAHPLSASQHVATIEALITAAAESRGLASHEVSVVVLTTAAAHSQGSTLVVAFLGPTTLIIGRVARGATL